MDQARFDELEKKKLGEGLTDEEAQELGRMYAEQKGEEYQSADEFQAQQQAEADEAGGGELGIEDRRETLKEIAEVGDTPREDEGAGTRAPIGARDQQAEEAQEKEERAG